MNYECFEHEKFVCFTIPKAGCSAIRCLMRHIATGEPFEEMEQTGMGPHHWWYANCQWRSYEELEADPRPMLAVVRNRFARVVSAYHDKIASPESGDFHIPGLRRVDWFSSLDREVSRCHEWEPHWRPQVFQFHPKAKLARLDNLQAGLEEFFRPLGIQIPQMTNQKKSPTPPQLTDREFRMLERICAIDKTIWMRDCLYPR